MKTDSTDTASPKRVHWWPSVLALTLCIGFWYYQKTSRYNIGPDSTDPNHSAEEPGQRAARLRAGAPDILKDACLQSVTGFSRIIKPDLDDSDVNPYNWTASPTVEYVNTMGGIERTNLFFIFAVHSGKLFCDPDLVKIAAREHEQLQADLHRALGN